MKPIIRRASCSVWLAAAAIFLVVGCSAGEIPEPGGTKADQPGQQDDPPPQQDPDPSNSSGPHYLDSNGDGKADGIDINGDGTPEYRFDDCATCVLTATICVDFVVDEDGDGTPEGFDIDCDGEIDILLPAGGGSGSNGGGGGGSRQTCQQQQTNNGDNKSISCVSIDGAPASCTCDHNGTITTCTDATPQDCNIGSADNCCGF
jgi:hypothetical protein